MLPNIGTLALFMVATLALLITPGPSVIYIVTRSLDQGRAAGIASVLGVNSATLVHVAFAALGLSTLLLASELAFNIVRILGAGYLIYIGISKIRSREELLPTAVVTRQPLGRVYTQGAIVNLLNPKTALFIFAFLPQFVDPARGAPALQIVSLGLVMCLLGLLSDGSYALLAGAISGWLRRNQQLIARQSYIAGGIYIALGISAALTGRHR